MAYHRGIFLTLREYFSKSHVLKLSRMSRHQNFASLTEKKKHMPSGTLLRLFRMLKLFPSVGTKVVKHYITVGVHRSFPQGVVS